MSEVLEIETENPEIVEIEAEDENFSLDIATCSKHLVRISNEEWFEISRELEQHHAVFYQVWQMGKPIFNEKIPTAGVQFDQNGQYIWFHFNPQFWKECNFYNKCFVICHEALHVLLNHGIRTQDAGINSQAANVALDVVVNHALVRGFGFDRSKIANQENYCWVDTVFKDKNPQPSSEESYEYYYSLFEKVYGDGGPGDGSGKGFGTVDDHSFMGEKSDKWDEVIDSLNETLTHEEKKSLKSTVDKHFQKSSEVLNQKAGTGTGGLWVFANLPKVQKKKKWETVIKKWSRKYMVDHYKDVEQWARLNRRMSILPRNMFLPSDMEVEDEEKEKVRIKVYFFMDTSGSCWGLKDRFFAAASSLPTNKFDVRLLCFDTQIQETTLESKKIYGGGGTSFHILEDFIQKEINEGGQYPEGVFVISDGYGDNINPMQPEKWHWFLTPGGVKNCISPNCNFYSLQDFE